MREYRNVSSFTDRLGVTRWRFRKTGHKTRMLPGQPGEREFDDAYDSIQAGMALPPASPAPDHAAPSAEVLRHPKAALPKSLRAAWLIVTTSTPEWKTMQFDTRARQSVIAETFLNALVTKKSTAVWGDVPVAELRRRHIKAIIAERQVTLHVTKQTLSLIRKMVSAAMDAEWIDVDPTYGVSFQPEYKGWRAWTREEMEKFETRWAIGTTPRLAYALALWLGNRRGDVCSLTVDAIEAEGVRVVQGKTGRPLIVPITPMMRDVLAATNLSEGTILKTVHGKAFLGEVDHRPDAGVDADGRPSARLYAPRSPQDARKDARRRRRDDAPDHGHARPYQHQACRALFERGRPAASFPATEWTKLFGCSAGARSSRHDARSGKLATQLANSSVST